MPISDIFISSRGLSLLDFLTPILLLPDDNIKYRVLS